MDNPYRARMARPRVACDHSEVFGTLEGNRETARRLEVAVLGSDDGDDLQVFVRQLCEVSFDSARIANVSLRVIHEADKGLAVGMSPVACSINNQLLTDLFFSESCPSHFGLYHELL